LLSPFIPPPSWKTSLDPQPRTKDDDEDEQEDDDEEEYDDENETLNRYKPGRLERTQAGSLCYIKPVRVVALGSWSLRPVLFRHRSTLRRVCVA
jgi:hypothetical protein